MISKQEAKDLTTISYDSVVNVHLKRIEEKITSSAKLGLLKTTITIPSHIYFDVEKILNNKGFEISSYKQNEHTRYLTIQWYD